MSFETHFISSFSSLCLKIYMCVYLFPAYIILYTLIEVHLVWTRVTHFFIYIEQNFWNESWNNIIYINRTTLKK